MTGYEARSEWGMERVEMDEFINGGYFISSGYGSCVVSSALIDGNPSTFVSFFSLSDFFLFSPSFFFFA